MSDTFEKNHLPVEDEQPTLSENKFPEVDEEEEDYDEPQPWMDEFEYIDWLISHRQDAVIMLTGGLYFIFSDAEIAESAFEMVQDVCDAANFYAS